MRRKKTSPILTASPPENRTVCSGSLSSTTYPSSVTLPAVSQIMSASKRSPDDVFSASI